VELGEDERPVPVNVTLGDPVHHRWLDIQPAQLLLSGAVVPLIDDIHRALEVGVLGRRVEPEFAHRLVPFVTGLFRVAGAGSVWVSPARRRMRWMASTAAAVRPAAMAAGPASVSGTVLPGAPRR